MNALSVVIITYNEQDNIRRCIASVKDIASEIIVVDSHSSDDTAAIAESMGARVFQHPFGGYAAQKNYATSLAGHDWILSLDADEELTPLLRQSVGQALEDPAFAVYQFPRLTNYCGQWIRHCGWYPDRQTRLYNRQAGAWKALRVHEFWQPVNPAEKTGLLRGDLLHYSFRSVADHLKKIDRYSTLAAREAADNGKSAGMLKIVLSPFWHFFSEYFLRLGFLEGYYGFVICRLSAYAAFTKYVRIRELSRQKNKP